MGRLQIFALIDTWSGIKQLFNCKHPKYHLHDEKMKLLEKIKGILYENGIEVTVKQIMDKIHSLRNYYGNFSKIQILLINSNALNILVIYKRTFPKEKTCIIDMLCYFIYIKKYENTFYNIVRAKLKIQTQAIFPQRFSFGSFQPNSTRLQN